MARDFIPYIQEEIKEINKKYPDIDIYKSFTYWYIRTFLWPTSFEWVWDPYDIKNCIYDQPGEKNIDAVYFDHDLVMVFVIQTKYRQGNTYESKADLKGFADTAYYLFDADEREFADYFADAAPQIKAIASDVRKKVLSNGYWPTLYYVTMGRARKDVERELAKQHADYCHFEVITRSDLNRVYENYVEVGQPPIPELEFPVAGQRPIGLPGINGMESWLFAIKGSELAEVFYKAGRRIFASNIRGFLGEKRVNKNIRETLENEPEKFWYLNNGITVICSAAKAESPSATKTSMLVKDAQIINGQQTVRTLAASFKKSDQAKMAKVLVKLFVIMPSESSEQLRLSRELVRAVVEGTNTQTAVDIVDLVSNDFLQIKIQREMMKLGYNYIRKRGLVESLAKGPKIRKENLALAVGCVNLDPGIPPRGKRELFEDHYARLFHEDYSPWLYLTAYYLYEFVNTISRRETGGDPEKTAGKYMVTRFFWDILIGGFRADNWSLARAFIDCYRSGKVDNEGLRRLKRLAKRGFRVAKSFYKESMKREKDPVEASGFYRREGLYRGFKRLFEELEKKTYKNKTNRTDNQVARFLEDLEALS